MMDSELGVLIRSYPHEFQTSCFDYLQNNGFTIEYNSRPLEEFISPATWKSCDAVILQLGDSASVSKEELESISSHVSLPLFMICSDFNPDFVRFQNSHRLIHLDESVSPLVLRANILAQATSRGKSEIFPEQSSACGSRCLSLGGKLCDSLCSCDFMGIAILNPLGQVKIATPFISRLTGLPDWKIPGMNFLEFLKDPDILEEIEEILGGRRNDHFQLNLNLSDSNGVTRPCLVSGRVFRSGDYHEILLLVFDTASDLLPGKIVSERQTDREMLMNEVNHRVKNNLQMVGSLVDMAALRVSDKSAAETLFSIRSKIYTVAMIHEQLYMENSLYYIDMGRHLENLMEYIRSSFAMNSTDNDYSRNLSVSIRSDRIILPLERAVPFSLVLNELISNSFKHGRREPDGKIEAIMWIDDQGRVCAEIRDNGPGVNLSRDLNNPSNLGLKLVKNIVSLQLKGTFEILGGDGFRARVSFRI